MLNLHFKTTVVFARNNIARSQVVVNRGGARSSKSHSISQLLTLRLLQGKGQRILCLRKSLPSARLSILPMFKEIWDDIGLTPYLKENKQFLDYNFSRNYLHIGSLDEATKIKSSEFSVVWLEEADEFSYNDFQILKLRLSRKTKDNYRNQIYLSFNPTDEFSWVKQKLLDNKSEDVTEIVSNYKDNPFLTSEYIDTLLALEQQDLNFYRIFTLGEWGKLTDLVYSNYDEVEEFPPLEDICYGLDFGFTHPTALVKIGFADNDVYLQELLYESKLTNTDLINRLRELIPNKDQEIWADSAYPSNIEEIFQAGFNVQPVVKSPFSVKNGISIVKCKKLHITKDSPNLLKETRSYSYRKDKSGRLLDEPVKFNDDLMDAMRYGIMSHMMSGEPRIRWI